MSDDKRRSFSQEFKLKAVERLEAGGNSEPGYRVPIIPWGASTGF
jgi:hypothetical protein